MKNIPHPRSTVKPIRRSAAGLRDACFDVLEKIRDGDMDCSDAKEFANVARVILESATIQMEFERDKQASEIPQHLSDMTLVPPIPALENQVGDEAEEV